MLNMSTTTMRADVSAFNDALDEFQRAQRRAQGRFNSAPLVPVLSTSQYHLLEPLANAGRPVCVGALADSAGVSAPSATRMLDGLVRRGIVERARDTEDRRLVHVELTDHGRELFASKQELILKARTEIFDALMPSERRAAARLLSGLAAAIDELHP
jgi:DNA-binding MarR family transcriptional regulator